MIKISNKSQQAKFAAVGGISTAIDFGILFSLYGIGMGGIGANFVSTFVAFCFSFIANRQYTFKATGSKRRQITLFFIVTFAGIWGIQPFIIWATKPSISLVIENEAIILFVAKLLATVVTLVWNYNLYSRVVFKQRKA